MKSARKRQRGRRSRFPTWRLVALAVACTAYAAWRVADGRQPGEWQRVFATREGQIGDVTASRTRIRPDSRFVALPDRSALGRLVEVRHGDRVVVVEVEDVGPWNIDDDYWTHGDRPAAERGRGAFRAPVNPAGIDLSDPVFAELGMRDNDTVEWRFVHRGIAWLPWR